VIKDLLWPLGLLGRFRYGIADRYFSFESAKLLVEYVHKGCRRMPWCLLRFEFYTLCFGVLPRAAASEGLRLIQPFTSSDMDSVTVEQGKDSELISDSACQWHCLRSSMQMTCVIFGSDRRTWKSISSPLSLRLTRTGTHQLTHNDPLTLTLPLIYPT
jgi:hypothetical protein